MNFRFRNRRRTASPVPVGGAGFRDSAPTAKGRVFGVLFGLPFFAGGLFFCWLGAIQPILGVLDSRNWHETPCTIASSKVERVRGSDGDTFRVAITFSYLFEGREYTGGSYDFSDMSSSGRKGKDEIVRRFPVGLETTCWVNPDNPSVAVLSRAVPGSVYFIIPFTSVFMLVGGAIMAGSLGLFPQKWTARFQTRHVRVAQEDKGDAELQPSSGPVGKLVGAILFAGFWNGIVGVFVGIAVNSFRKGDPEWFLVIFLIPFVAVGIGAIGAIVYFALALSNPKVRLSLSEGSPRLGESVRLRWRLSGSIHRLKSLEIAVEGREAATYTVGTRSTTDTSVFSRGIVLETDNPAALTHGEIEFSVPEDLMHTFSGGNNKIEWSIAVRGQIPRWPNVNDTYPVVVCPRRLA